MKVKRRFTINNNNEVQKDLFQIPIKYAVVVRNNNKKKQQTNLLLEESESQPAMKIYLWDFFPKFLIQAKLKIFFPFSFFFFLFFLSFS